MQPLRARGALRLVKSVSLRQARRGLGHDTRRGHIDKAPVSEVNLIRAMADHANALAQDDFGKRCMARAGDALRILSGNSIAGRCLRAGAPAVGLAAVRYLLRIEVACFSHRCKFNERMQGIYAEFNKHERFSQQGNIRT